MVNVLKFQTLLSCRSTTKVLAIRALNHKMLVRNQIANRKDPDQDKKQSDLGLHYLSIPFDMVISVRNFRTLMSWYPA